MGMLRFPLLSRDSSCREKAAGLLPALPARGVPPCPGCDGAIPLLPPCLHRESVWCIGAVRACPIQTKRSQEVQQAGPGERDASSGRPAWQGPGGLCFGALQHFSSWKAPLKEGRSMAPSQVQLCRKLCFIPHQWNKGSIGGPWGAGAFGGCCVRAVAVVLKNHVLRQREMVNLAPLC